MNSIEEWEELQRYQTRRMQEDTLKLERECKRQNIRFIRFLREPIGEQK